MSIVGPRPLVKNQYDMIPEDFQQKIKLVKPGITGIGSFIIDVLLILTTIIMVFSPSINLHKYFFGDLPQHPLFNPA